MLDQSLWSNEIEIEFFKQSLSHFAAPEKLFYKLKDGYFAYVPKRYDTDGQTLQSRNALIGEFTEKWCKTLLTPIAKACNLFALNGVICKELGLVRNSSADLAFCTKESQEQQPEDIKLIFEIKMSVISNYRYDKNTKTVTFVGDYTTHKGKPSLLRSDSMLKAIGKSINIRVSGSAATKIPIVVLGNSPIKQSYGEKVDFLKTSGIVQGFLSLNPRPTNLPYIEKTSRSGFQTITSLQQIKDFLLSLIDSDINFFSSMMSKDRLGKIISIAAKEVTDIQKAEKFLSLLKS